MIRVVLLTFVSFGLYFFLDDLYFKGLRTWLNKAIQQLGVSHILTYALSGIPIYVGILLLHGKGTFWRSLGLDKSLLKGVLFSLLCTLPMFIGFAIVFNFNAQVSWNDLLIGVVAAGFFEELFYRGVLFGQLYRYTRLGFITSVLLAALLFGLIHLYQGNEFGELVGIFLITFLGAILFAWVYVEWDFNLWFPIFLHMLMNLGWELFSVSDNALGGTYSNLFRTATILLIIGLTLAYKWKKGIPFEITKSTFFIKNKSWVPK